MTDAAAELNAAIAAQDQAIADLAAAIDREVADLLAQIEDARAELATTSAEHAALLDSIVTSAADIQGNTAALAAKTAELVANDTPEPTPEP